MLQVVVLGAGVEPRRLVAAEARVDERHHAAQADGRQRVMAGHGRLEARAGREGVATAEPCGRAPEFLAVDPMREKIASDAQVRVAYAIQDQRQADPCEHPLVVELIGQPAAAEVAGGRDRNVARSHGRFTIQEDEPGRVGQWIRGEHAGDLEQQGGARATIVDAEEAEALVAPRVIGRDEQKDVARAPGDLGGDIPERERLLFLLPLLLPLLLLPAPAHRDVLLDDLEFELRELAEDVVAGAAHTLGPHHPRPDLRERAEILPGALRLESPGTLGGGGWNPGSGRGGRLACEPECEQQGHGQQAGAHRDPGPPSGTDTTV